MSITNGHGEVAGLVEEMRADRDQWRDLARLERERGDEQHDIVARIWKMLGSPSYEELAGRTIYDLIDEKLKLAAPTPPPVEARADGVSEALEAFNNLIRYGARMHSLGGLQTPDGTLFRFDDREAYFLSDSDRDAILAALESTPAQPAREGQKGGET